MGSALHKGSCRRHPWGTSNPWCFCSKVLKNQWLERIAGQIRFYLLQLRCHNCSSLELAIWSNVNWVFYLGITYPLLLKLSQRIVCFPFFWKRWSCRLNRSPRCNLKKGKLRLLFVLHCCPLKTKQPNLTWFFSFYGDKDSNQFRDPSAYPMWNWNATL
jgi:hypothetical protein